MSNYGEEAADLAKLDGALVINMGTVTPEGLDNYKKARSAYVNAKRPVILDPVGYVTTRFPLLQASIDSDHITAPGRQVCAWQP
jgi:hydroxyethylthiazole kinase-like sugar kinase family protein